MGPKPTRTDVVSKNIEVFIEQLPTMVEHNSVFMHDDILIYKTHKVHDCIVEQAIGLMY